MASPIPQIPASFQGNPLMVSEWLRLVSAGNDPVGAENAVKQAVGGLPKDWDPNATSQSVMGNVGYQGAQDVGQWVNQLNNWEKFRDPACPPDQPFRPDAGHIKSAFGIDIGDPNQHCVEKPVDVPGQFWGTEKGGPNDPARMQGQQPAGAEVSGGPDYGKQLQDLMAQMQSFTPQAKPMGQSQLAQSIAPVQSSTQSLMVRTPQQTGQATIPKLGDLGTGWSSTQGNVGQQNGLTGMMGPLQKPKRQPGILGSAVQRWF